MELPTSEPVVMWMDEDPCHSGQKIDSPYLEAFLLIGDEIYKKEDVSATKLYSMLRENLGIPPGMCPDIIGYLQRLNLIKIEQNNGGITYELTDHGLKVYRDARGLNPEKMKDNRSITESFRGIIHPFL